MKILLTSTWFPTQNNPYNGDFVQRFAKAISSKVDVTVLHVESHVSCANKEVIIDKSNNYKEIIVYIPAWKWKFLNTFRRMREFQKQVQSLGKFDLIHGNIIYTDSLWLVFRKWFYKTPFVLTEHWTTYSKPNHKLSFGHKILAQLVAQQASIVFPVSYSLQKGMQSLGIKAHYIVIPNIVDTELFKPCLRENKSIEKIHFIHVSSLNNKQKNITGILSVCHKLQQQKIPYKLTLIGYDDDACWEKYVKDKQLKHVALIGQKTHTAVAKIMQQADCLILFSNYENQPCVIGESFACGLPVIATNVGGIAEFFPDDFGYIISKGDEEALYYSMLKVIHNASFSSKDTMHKYACRVFSEDKIIEKFVQHYKMLTS